MSRIRFSIRWARFVFRFTSAFVVERLRNVRRDRLRLCLFIYFTLVLCYELFEINLLDVDLFRRSVTSPHVPDVCGNNVDQNLIRCRNTGLFDSPIDAVYTWVNGSDPYLVEALKQTAIQLANQRLSPFCLFGSECVEVAQSCILLPLLLLRPSLLNAERYFDGATRSEQLENHNATLIYLSNLHKARSLGANCVRIINDRIYKLTNICIDDQTDSRPLSNNEFTLSSFVCLHNTSSLPEFVRHDPLKHFAPSIRKQFKLISLENETMTNDSLKLYMAHSKSNCSKIVNFIRDKENNSATYRFSIKYPLSIFLTDRQFFAHQLEDENIRPNRFADNDELRYSLRSLERFAPWIQRVFIVTNGQLPIWLNLDNTKVQLIQHKDIFPNRSHLPSFSSSAIESHLFRIPGLSKRFLYFNDDIILGQPIYPDDFYTKSRGFKVYLSWPVPNCADGCPLNWLNDGHCDKACNTSKCLWDGGDCISNVANLQNRNATNISAASIEQNLESEKLCAPNCIENWLGDSFCDQVCNKLECGFDMTDCGVANFDKNFEQISILAHKNEYIYSANSSFIYLNFTEFLRPDDQWEQKYKLQLTEATYENNSLIRSASLNLNNHILAILFRPNINPEVLNFTLSAMVNQRNFNLSLFIVPDLFLSNYPSRGGELFNLSNFLQQNEPNVSLLQIESIPETENPHTLSPIVLETLSCGVNVSSLPSLLREKFEYVEQQFTDELLTDRGKQHFYAQLVGLFSDLICNETFAHRKVGDIPLENFLSHYILDTDQKYRSRRLMDVFADSLIFVNHLYNKAFGVQPRKVPAHMAHFIDRDIMARLQARFSEHFERTSSQKIRSSDDMQFSFSYYYYLMSETQECDIESVLTEFDTDNSNALSLNELKTLVIQLNGLPRNDELEKQFYLELDYCCHGCLQQLLNQTNNGTTDQTIWRIDFEFKELRDCDNFRKRISTKWPKKNRNRFEVLPDDDISFKMLKSDQKMLEDELDQLRGKRTKFICLNDNFEHYGTNESQKQKLKQILELFYESILPNRSQFERPANDYNKFLHISAYQKRNATQIWMDHLYTKFSYLFIIINVLLFIKMLM